MRIAVEPDALIGAGRQMGSLGAQLGMLSDALGGALSGGIASGTDPAGLNFGLTYGHQAEEFANTVADAANTFTSVGFLLAATGDNYRNADAASTIGGPGPTSGVRGIPGQTLPAHVPPGPNGVTVPPPAMWHVIAPLLHVLPGFGLVAGTAMTWPSGNAAMMGVTAVQWRNFATGFALIEPQLAGIKSAVGGQSIPEGAAIVSALDSLGQAIAVLADVSSSVAQSITDFAGDVQATQDAIRRFMDRLSIGGLWDTVTGILTGEGDDILREVARDVGTVLDNFQQQVNGIVGLLDELAVITGEAATTLQKWIRPILVEQFGDRVGGLLADAVTLYTDVQVGAGTGLIGSVSGTVALADPDTWTGMAELALSVAQDPSTLPGVVTNMAKEQFAWDTWSGDHPGRAAGEAAFNIGSLFVPGGALSKTGSVAKGVNLTRRALDERRLPQLGELGSWTRGDTPRMPQVPPVGPAGIPGPTPPTPQTGAGPGRAVEQPPALPGGRPPNAEGGPGQRAPLDQPGRVSTGAPPSPEPTPGPSTYSESGSSPSDSMHQQDPVHSDQDHGDGWHRRDDTPHDPHYGHPLTHHWESGDYPRPTDENRSTFDLVEHPQEPYGHDADGTPLSRAEYDERYNVIGPDGQHWANYPPNDGAVPGTRVLYDSGDAFIRDYGTSLDRIGEASGRYLALVPDGQPPSFESRSLPISSLELPYHGFTLASLPEGWSIEVSEIAPAFGRDGGSLQVLIFDERGRSMSITTLIAAGVIS